MYNHQETDGKKYHNKERSNTRLEKKWDFHNSLANTQSNKEIPLPKIP